MKDIDDIVDKHNSIMTELMYNQLSSIRWDLELWKLEFYVDEIISPIIDSVIHYVHYYNLEDQ
jgi:hypothetical protein